MNYLYIFVPFVIWLMLFRKGWCDYNLNKHYTIAALYIHLEKVPDNEKMPFFELWPKKHMLYDFFNWDFRKYVVNQDLYDEMMVWFDKRMDQKIKEQETGKKNE